MYSSNATDASNLPPKPWYRIPWVWLVIFFPASAIVAGLITVVIAFKHSDSLVNDEWYKDGMAINQQLDKKNTAKTLNISADISFDINRKQLTIQLTGGNEIQKSPLTVSLSHPTQPEKDNTVKAFYTPQGLYVAQLPYPPKGYFHLRLDDKNNSWQLNGGINFSHSTIKTHIQPH